LLAKNIIKTFFAISGEEGKFTYNRGWESIPQNWYRTPVDYGLAQLNSDIVSFILEYPDLGRCVVPRMFIEWLLTHISIGGNTGTVNSFTGVNFEDLTSGILNAETLLEGNNLLCFVFEAVRTLAPNLLSSLFSVLEAPLQLITDTLVSAPTNLACPALTDLKIGGQGFEDAIKTMFPGTRKSGGAL
jgi:hypothetical protein